MSKFVNLSKKITDYNAGDETVDPDLEWEETEIDEVGIPVVFDSDEEDQETFYEGFVIREESDEGKEQQGTSENHWNIVEWATGGGHF